MHQKKRICCLALLALPVTWFVPCNFMCAQTPESKRTLPSMTASQIQRLPNATASCRDILAQLVQQACSASPAIAAAQARLEAAGGSALQASLYPNPKIGYQAQEIGNDDSAGQYGVFLQQTRIRGNKIALRQNVTEQEYLARQIDVQSALLSTKIKVGLTFYRTLIANQRIRLLTDLIARADQTEQAIAKLVEAGEMAKTAELQAGLAVMNLRTQWIVAQKDFQAGWRALAAMVNTPAESLPHLTCDGFDELPNYGWEQMAQRAAMSLKAQRRQIVVGKAAGQVELEQAKRIVDFNWQVSVYFDDSTDDVFTGVQLSHPLQINDSNQGNIQRAGANLAATQSEVDIALQQTMINVAAAFREFDSQRATASMIASQLLPAASESLKLTQMALQAGEIGYLEALVAQQAYAQANQQYFDAILAAWQAAAQLESQFID